MRCPNSVKVVLVEFRSAVAFSSVRLFPVDKSKLLAVEEADSLVRSISEDDKETIVLLLFCDLGPPKLASGVTTSSANAPSLSKTRPF